jgi:hypothetical protein
MSSVIVQGTEFVALRIPSFLVTWHGKAFHAIFYRGQATSLLLPADWELWRSRCFQKSRDHNAEGLERVREQRDRIALLALL